DYYCYSGDGTSWVF
nr:immunoglobulin light chain junction region [Macaca mulatta]MOW16575.1 immunoglobulin light chain junction region [Macaca mulatta]MOW16660.1 immunoglobulin light chain junction region [Macaca mulatta]MOW17680.1 immunoglobulin light chain junction region [Macaca mulatta]